MSDLLADAIIAAAREMNDRGVNSGSSGNVSARTDSGMLITPSAVDYARLTPTDIVWMDHDSTWGCATDRHPSSEWRFHIDIYRTRPDIAAIVHAHPINATAIAVHGRGIGPFHYMIAVAGGHDIRCAPYATFGTPELSEHVVRALEGRRACLIEHHGIIATGESLDAALALAVEVETLATQFLAALALGPPPELTSQQLDEVLEKMRGPGGYGSDPPPPTTSATSDGR